VAASLIILGLLAVVDKGFRREVMVLVSLDQKICGRGK